MDPPSTLRLRLRNHFVSLHRTGDQMGQITVRLRPNAGIRQGLTRLLFRPFASLKFSDQRIQLPYQVIWRSRRSKSFH